MTERGGRSGSNLWGKKQDRARSVTRANPVQVFREEADVNRPRSAAQKWREGERRSERLNLDEPNFGDAAVDPHSSLTTDGEREVWQRLVRILMQAGVLQESDRDALAALCRMQVAFERETDPVQMRHLSRELRALWDLFGLTPRSRAMIQGSARAVDTSDEPQAYSIHSPAQTSVATISAGRPGPGLPPVYTSSLVERSSARARVT